MSEYVTLVTKSDQSRLLERRRHTWKDNINNLKTDSDSQFTLRLGVYHQSVRVGAKPLEAHDQRYFSTEPLRS
jgi:hypothetical protein